MFKVGPVLTTSLYVHYLLSWDSSSSFATRCYLSTAVPSAKAVLIHSIACHDWQVKCDHHYIQEACISFLVVIILFVPLMCKKKKTKKTPMSKTVTTDCCYKGICAQLLVMVAFFLFRRMQLFLWTGENDGVRHCEELRWYRFGYTLPVKFPPLFIPLYL